MTAIAPEPSALTDLPSMPESAKPLLLPCLLHGLGLIASIQVGLMDIPDDLNTTRGKRS